jgi:hypothetical protein
MAEVRERWAAAASASFLSAEAGGIVTGSPTAVTVVEHEPQARLLVFRRVR